MKSVYRSRGVAVSGTAVYTALKRGAYLARLPRAAQPLAELLYEELDALAGQKRAAEKALLAEAKRHPEFALVKSCPGLGPIRAAQLLPIVVTPYRFRSKRGFWAYCGLGIVTRSSSDWVRARTGEWVKAEVKRTRGLNRNFNRTLKAIFKGAATTVRWGWGPKGVRRRRFVGAMGRRWVARRGVGREGRRGCADRRAACSSGRAQSQPRWGLSLRAG